MTEKKFVVLIVDDEPEVREVFAGLVAHFGYHAIPVENSERALLTLARRQPDILLVAREISMGGEELPMLAKSIAPDIRVIMTTTGFAEDIAACPGAAAIDYILEKPFSDAALNAAIREVLAAA